MSDTYETLAGALADTMPTLAANLNKAHQHRLFHLELITSEEHFRLYVTGMDEWLRYFDVLAQSVKKGDELYRVRRLLMRAREDFAVSIEAAFSGYYSSVIEKMRDVLEIQLLFAEFQGARNSIEAWLNATQQDLKGRFSPGRLRETEAKRRRVAAKDLPGAEDYKAHSHFLHVGPDLHPFEGLGIGVPESLTALYFEACFWELYFHALALLESTIDLFGSHLEATPELDYQEHLAQFRNALHMARKRETQYGKDWIAIGRIRDEVVKDLMVSSELSGQASHVVAPDSNEH